MRESYEDDLRRILIDRVRHGMTVFDVGGHIGFIALVCAGLGARVITLEPSPVNFVRLQRNLSLNPDRMVTAINVGASDECGLTKLTDSSSMSKISSEGSIPIRLIRLDDIAAEHGFPEFIKIDVEGHAGAVLRGAPRVLRHHPDIVIEIHDELEERAVTSALIPLYAARPVGDQSSYPKRTIWCVPKDSQL
jgi:FkbM family methyltransferase